MYTLDLSVCVTKLSVTKWIEECFAGAGLHRNHESFYGQMPLENLSLTEIESFYLRICEWSIIFMPAKQSRYIISTLFHN
jgi:hypothetical protein